MRLVLLEQIPEDEDLRRQWNSLLERCEDSQVFYTYEWSLAVQRAYRDSLLPLLFLAYDEEGALCGVAALATNAAGNEGSFLCGTTGDYCDFLSAPECKREFVNAVLGVLKRRSISRMAFANLPADSGTVATLRQGAREHGCLCFARSAYVCAQVSLDRLERNRVGKSIAPGLKRIRRFVNAMAREAPVRFEEDRSWDALQPVLPQFMQVHVARFLEIGRISNFVNPRRRAFLAELAKLLSGAQWMVLSRMIAGQQTVAWHYGFQFGSSWFWYQPTFDGRFEKYWPGFCLLSHVIQEATENPELKMVDLGLGGEVYKAKFANGTRETLHITLHRSFLHHVRTVLRYRVTEVLKTYPATENFAELLRKGFRAVRGRVGKDGARPTLVWAMKRLTQLLWMKDEVLFYEFTREQARSESGSLSLNLIDLDLLAAAAMQYSDDEETLTYLLRCAKRLRMKKYAGFALMNEDGLPVHFTWAGPFAGFHWDELNDTVPAPSPDAVVLFDSWTPAVQRGRGYYAPTLELVAATIRRQGKSAWGFSAVTNTSSIRGLEKLGCPLRFSVVRHKVLWWQQLSQHHEENAIRAQQLVA